MDEIPVGCHQQFFGSRSVFAQKSAFVSPTHWGHLPYKRLQHIEADLADEVPWGTPSGIRVSV